MKITSKINEKELFDFLMKHTYSSGWGFAGILISLCAVLAFIQMCLSGGAMITKICLLITALLFSVVQPLRLYLRAQKLMESDEGYQVPTEYQFDEKGMKIARGEEQAFYAWGEVKKVVSTKKVVAIYVGNRVVLKIARRDMEDQYMEFCSLVRKSAVNASVMLKK